MVRSPWQLTYHHLVDIKIAYRNQEAAFSLFPSKLCPAEHLQQYLHLVPRSQTEHTSLAKALSNLLHRSVSLSKVQHNMPRYYNGFMGGKLQTWLPFTLNCLLLLMPKAIEIFSHNLGGGWVWFPLWPCVSNYQYMDKLFCNGLLLNWKNVLWKKKVYTIVILLCLTPDDFTRQWRASGWERVKIRMPYWIMWKSNKKY